MPDNKNFEASQIKMHLNKKMISDMEASLGQDDVDNVYREFTDSLKKLRDKTEDYYTQDNNGQFPELSKDQLKELRDFYETAAEKAQNVIAAEADKNDEKAKNFKDIANVLKPLIEADQKALGTAAEADIKMSLPELIFKGRSAAVYVGRAGAQMSDRVILELDNVYDPDTGMTKPKKGYFTKEVPLQIEAQFDNMCRKLDAKFGDDYKDIINQIRKAPIKNKIKLFMDKDCVKALDPDKNDPILASSRHNMSLEQVANKYNQITWVPLFNGTDQISDVSRSLTQLTNKDDFFDFQDEVQKGLWGFVVQYSLLSKHSKNAFSLNLEEGAPLASRNAAMYDMAKLFGVQDIVAEAKSVTLMQDGKEIKGVLMSEVEGLDSGKVTMAEIDNYTDETFNTPELKKKMSELQALDWICGNADRHQGNFILQFENRGKPDARAIRIVGIDNDNSFSTKSSTMKGGHLAEPKNMVVISKSFCERMKNITEEQFNTVLDGHGLSQDEKKAAWQRREILMDNIRENKIEVIDDNNWNKYSLNELAEMQWKKYPKRDTHKQGLFVRMDKAATRFNQDISNNFEKESKEIKRERNLKTLRRKIRERRPEINNEKNLNDLGNDGSLPVKKEKKIVGSIVGTALSYKNDPDTLRLVLPELADVKSTGGALSERFPISFNENGKKVEGFFTKPVVTSINAAVGTVIDQAAEKYPKYKTVWNRLKDHLQTNGGSEALVDIHIEATTLTLDSLGINDPSLNNNNDFDQAFHEVRSGITRRIQNLGHYYDIGADQNERTDLRNVTMSEVADALGKPELLARSRNVQVLSGGEIMEGVFMEKAKGEDIRYIEPDRGLGRLTEENSEAAFNNAQGLKSLADLQVIDYICNNTDRHSRNIFYQFDNSDPQKPKLIGVQGIDNDMSFGLGKQNPDHTNVTVMTEEMAEKIRDGKYKEEIENRLKKSALSKAAQKAVLDRIDDLKNDLNDGKVKVVQNDEWGSGDYSFEKLNIKGIFREANNARKDAVKNNKKLKNQAEQNAEQDEKENAPLIFAKAARVKSFGMNAEEKKEYKELCTEAEREFTKKMDEVISRAQPKDDAEWDNVGTHKEFIRKLKRSCKDMKEVLGAADPLFHKSSSQYKDVKNNMNELISSVNTISKRLDKNRDPNAEMTEAEMQKLYAHLTALSRSADTYQGIRRYEEGSTLSKQKYRACDVLKNNKSLIVVSLLNMRHKAQIKDMDSARNKLQVSLTRTIDLAQKETDKNDLLKCAAQEIYYKSVQKSDFYTVKNNEQLIKALSPLNRRDGIKLIMNDPAFKTIADKSDAEVKAMCAEPDKLYNAFIISKAKNKEFKNKFGEKQIKEDIAEKQKENKPNRQNEGPKLNHK